MTALVGILNQKAAVIAADSATTFRMANGRSVCNYTETKIFKLSETHPVSVMLYNFVDFMCTPWEVIVKLYCEKRGDRPFGTLREYVEDFRDFVRTEFPPAEDTQKDVLHGDMMRFFQMVKDLAMDDYNTSCEGKDDSEHESLLRESVHKTLLEVADFAAENGCFGEFEDFTYDRFLSVAEEPLKDFLQQCADAGLPTDMLDEWQDAAYKYIRSVHSDFCSSLVFVGYGCNDIYPSFIEMTLSGYIDGRMRCTVKEDENNKVSNSNPSVIQPFAQTDVVMSILRGIAPDLQNHVSFLFSECVGKTRRKMLKAMDVAMKSAKISPKIQKQITDELEKDLSGINEDNDKSLEQYILENYVENLYGAVAGFNVADMARMAENLISITNLQRHITSSEESVGGPIDVAVITRFEGFRWIKNKQIFNN